MCNNENEKSIMDINSNYLPDFNTPDDILKYGSEATSENIQILDDILSKINLTYTSESSKLMKNLNNLMERFDKSDFEEDDRKGLLKAVFRNAQRRINSIYEKYIVFSKQVEKIFIEVKKYELEVNDSNTMLLQMYDRNMEFYSQLDNYVLKAEEYLEENLKPRLEELNKKAQEDNDGEAQMEAGKLNEFRVILEQRIYDSELAKAVSLQTAPQIKLIQKGNYNLSRKINSAFVITLPLFKQEIIQAITIKRQKIQMDSLKALDDSTNKLIKQNAENIVNNTKKSVEFNKNSAVSIETLEQSYNTIIMGIREIEELEAENKLERLNSLKQLKTLRESLLTGKPIEKDEAAE